MPTLELGYLQSGMSRMQEDDGGAYSSSDEEEMDVAMDSNNREVQLSFLSINF